MGAEIPVRTITGKTHAELLIDAAVAVVVDPIASGLDVPIVRSDSRIVAEPCAVLRADHRHLHAGAEGLAIGLSEAPRGGVHVGAVTPVPDLIIDPILQDILGRGVRVPIRVSCIRSDIDVRIGRVPASSSLLEIERIQSVVHIERTRIGIGLRIREDDRFGHRTSENNPGEKSGHRDPPSDIVANGFKRFHTHHSARFLPLASSDMEMAFLRQKKGAWRVDTPRGSWYQNGPIFLRNNGADAGVRRTHSKLSPKWS